MADQYDGQRFLWIVLCQILGLLAVSCLRNICCKLNIPNGIFKMVNENCHLFQTKELEIFEDADYEILVVLKNQHINPYYYLWSVPFLFEPRDHEIFTENC